LIARSASRIRRQQRRLGDEAGKAVGMFGDDLGVAVVEQADEVLELVGLADALGRRHRIGDDLGVVVEHVDDPAAHIEIVDAGDLAHPLADVLVVAFQQLGEVFFRDEMGIRVDAHGRLRRSGLAQGRLDKRAVALDRFPIQVNRKAI
jgi:hypothetical protein